MRERAILRTKKSKTTKTKSWVDEGLTKSPKKKRFEEKGTVRNTEKSRTTKKRWVEEDLSKIPKNDYAEKKKKKSQTVTSLCSHVFVKQVCFFLRWITADPSPWGNFTPPTKQSVERPWGILSLFVTRLRLQVKSHFVNQIVFLTVNHRGPLPLKELHSTGETIAWRDPGGSWACLRPFMIMCEITLWESVSHVTYTGINSMHSQKRKEPYGALERTEL